MATPASRNRHAELLDTVAQRVEPSGHDDCGRQTRQIVGQRRNAVLIVVVAVFAALAAVPAVDQPTLFGHWLEALAATIAITAGVIVVVVAWRRPPGR
ncbi:hypothetical protein GS440_13295 [Rhodococcus hoagii]|nr:hypothetical protein [Prescottella equi]